MIVYIITRISSEGLCDGSESINIVSTDPEDAIRTAYIDYEEVWKTDEVDEDFSEHLDEAEFSKIMYEGFSMGRKNINNYVLIQFYDSHTQYEPFAANLGPNTFDRTSLVASKLWSKEDILSSLNQNGYEGTDLQIDAVLDTGYLSALNECTDRDWEIIDQAICEAHRKGAI